MLLKLIIGLQQPDAGTIRIDGQEVAGARSDDLVEIRKRIGFLFQHAALYDSLTVEENVAFPLGRHSRLSPEEQKNKARELLTSIGMAQDLQKLPGNISGGMQKRVGLARALALDPEILLCDEPTAGLDPITAAEIGELIVQLKRERQVTTIVVTHDLRGAKLFADRLALLNQGQVVAQGQFDELAAHQDPFVQKFFQEAQS